MYISKDEGQNAFITWVLVWGPTQSDDTTYCVWVWHTTIIYYQELAYHSSEIIVRYVKGKKQMGVVCSDFIRGKQCYLSSATYMNFFFFSFFFFFFLSLGEMVIECTRIGTTSGRVRVRVRVR